ncbi:MAG: DinB family protein [Gemmatimonadaceae bacterium]
MKAPINRPDPSEHPPFAITYINATDAALSEAKLSDVRELLAKQCDQLDSMLKGVTEDQANRAYAEGKWTLKESIVHISDAERVFSYRCMRVARADKTSLPGFDQDAFVPESRSNMRTLADVLAEFRAIRGATLALVNSLDAAAIAQVGVSSGNPFSARAFCWVIAGHAVHHINLTRDRYLAALK